MSNIAVIGAGYVGLTSAACLSHLGHIVVCADIDRSRVENLNAGRVPIFENGLDELLAAGLEKNTVSFVVGAKNAVQSAEFVFLCLPTPQGEDGSADLSYIESVAEEIASVLLPGTVVINKSTVPVGSAARVAAIIGRDDVAVVSNPEFLREGSAVSDFLQPDRIVVGSSNVDAAKAVAQLYSSIDAETVITTAESAEMIKYCANSFLAMKISFTNEIATLCEQLGADIFDVVKGVGLDSRIGGAFMSAGPGWGGSCFPKDSRALLKIANGVGHDFEMLNAAVAANDSQLERVLRKVQIAAGDTLDGKTVAIWGLTFKANTDDLRDSPAVALVNRLTSHGATVKAYDPTVKSHRAGVPESIVICESAVDAANGADVVAVLTEWSDFRAQSPDEVHNVVAHAAVVDARNVLDRDLWVEAGFTYTGIGR